MSVVHWDDVEPRRLEQGHLGGSWRFLGRAAGSKGVTVNRIQVDPGRWSTPAHVEGEEIFFVLGGSGLSWQDGDVYEVGAGDCIVHRADWEAHTLRAGDDGLDVLAFGPKAGLVTPHLPRAGVSWLFPSWVEAGGGARPWEREAAAGEPEVGEASERPKNIINVDALEPDEEGDRSSADRPARSIRASTIGRSPRAVPPCRRTATRPRRRSSSCWRAPRPSS